MPDGARRTVGCLVIAKGAFNLITGLVLATLGTFVLSVAAKTHAESGATAPAIIAPFLARPGLFVVLCLPAILGGLWLIFTPRHRWIVMIVSTLFLLGATLLVLGALISGLAPLYSMQSI